MRIARFGEVGPLSLRAQQRLVKAYAALNLKVEFISMPGERALNDSASGALDGDLIRIAELESKYPTLIKVNTPIVFTELVVFAAKNNIDVSKGWQSLKDYHISFSRGLKLAEQETAKFKFVSKVNDDETAFKLLEMGRVDVVLTDLIEGQAVLDKMKLSGIKPLKPSLSRVPLYHYLNNRHKHLVPQLERELKKTE